MERIVNHPILGPRKDSRREVSFTFNGQRLTGLEGEPVAAALLAAGIRIWRRHEESGSPRGLYCAIGHCMECRLLVEGMGLARACLTPLKANMQLAEGPQLPNEITGRKLT
ncbi:(2Fe-2S)-binding protein [Paenibacillus sanguinis]|uniref:(2Fe-2S)-binding protein n=1 Tax=Paenibacillus sanguinis TaxID=225906 RepID=UPI00036A51F8|nr:(2Fe-2S)-binding protein [Paenibacillus sanguinis]